LSAWHKADNPNAPEFVRSIMTAAHDLPVERRAVFRERLAAMLRLRRPSMTMSPKWSGWRRAGLCRHRQRRCDGRGAALDQPGIDRRTTSDAQKKA
jgi:hypothetical protein